MTRLTEYHEGVAVIKGKRFKEAAEKLAMFEDREDKRCEYCKDGKRLCGQSIMKTNYGWQEIYYCPNCGAKLEGDGSDE